MKLSKELSSYESKRLASDLGIQDADSSLAYKRPRRDQAYEKRVLQNSDSQSDDKEILQPFPQVPLFGSEVSR